VVALQLAEELGAAGLQVGGDRVDVLDGEAGNGRYRWVRRRVPVVASYAGESNLISSSRA
jgi:hypothetical protein